MSSRQNSLFNHNLDYIGQQPNLPTSSRRDRRSRLSPFEEVKLFNSSANRVDEDLPYTYSLKISQILKDKDFNPFSVIQIMENTFTSIVIPTSEKNILLASQYVSQLLHNRPEFSFSELMNWFVKFLIKTKELIDISKKKFSDEIKLTYSFAKYLYALAVLRFTEETENLPLSDYHSYIRMAEDPKAAEKIKLLRSYFLRKIESNLAIHEEILTSLNELGNFFIPKSESKITSYDDLLPEDFFIFWEEKCDDFEYCRTAAERPTSNQLELFRRACQTVLDDPSVDLKEDWPTTVEMIQSIKDSKTYNTQTKKTEWLKDVARKNLDRLFEKSFLNITSLNFKRTIVPIAPANYRDAWTADFDSRCFLSFCDKKVNKILEKHPKFGMCSGSSLSRKLDRIRQHQGLYMMVDLKKAGLTLPYSILRVACETLSDRLKSDVFIRLSKMYENLSVLDKDEEVRVLRGMGLGMLNSIYTFIHIAISELINDDGLFFSDDSVYLLGEDYAKESLPTVYNNYLAIYEQLGFLMSRKKGMISKGFVFLEEYFKFAHYDNRKVLRINMSMFNSIFSKSKFEVKMKFNQIARSIYLEEGKIDELFDILIQFTKRTINVRLDLEKILPEKLGGWGLIPRRSDLNYDLVFLDRITESEVPIVARAMRVLPDLRKKILKRTFPKFNFRPSDLGLPNYTIEEKTPIDAFLRKYDPQNIIKNLSDCLTSISIENRGRNLLEESRKIDLAILRIGDDVGPEDGISKYDLTNRLMNAAIEEGEFNFALPQNVVLQEEVVDELNIIRNKTYKVFVQKLNVPMSEIAHSQAYLFGATKVEPKFKMSRPMPPWWVYWYDPDGMILLHDMDYLEEYLKIQLSQFGAQPDQIWLDYVLRTNKRPIQVHNLFRPLFEVPKLQFDRGIYLVTPIFNIIHIPQEFEEDFVEIWYKLSRRYREYLSYVLLSENKKRYGLILSQFRRVPLKYTSDEDIEKEFRLNPILFFGDDISLSDVESDSEEESPHDTVTQAINLGLVPRREPLKILEEYYDEAEKLLNNIDLNEFRSPVLEEYEIIREEIFNLDSLAELIPQSEDEPITDKFIPLLGAIPEEEEKILDEPEELKYPAQTNLQLEMNPALQLINSVDLSSLTDDTTEQLEETDFPVPEGLDDLDLESFEDNFDDF